MAARLKWRNRPLISIEIASQLPKLGLMRKLLQFIRSDAKLPVFFYRMGAQTIMKKNTGIRRGLAIASLPLLLAGCASDEAPPAPILSGDQMIRESQGMAQLGNRWQQGKQMVEQGQNLQVEGQAKINEGRRMIEEGQKIMNESEEGYKDIN